MLEVVINNEMVMTFDTNRFPGHQRQFLDIMDMGMDEGIKLDGEQINKPDDIQRAKYVAMNLILALQEGNNNMANAMCVYLAHRQPGLKQVRAIDNGVDVELDLLYTGKTSFK